MQLITKSLKLVSLTINAQKVNWQLLLRPRDTKEGRKKSQKSPATITAAVISPVFQLSSHHSLLSSPTQHYTLPFLSFYSLNLSWHFYFYSAVLRADGHTLRIICFHIFFFHVLLVQWEQGKAKEGSGYKWVVGRHSTEWTWTSTRHKTQLQQALGFSSFPCSTMESENWIRGECFLKRPCHFDKWL